MMAERTIKEELNWYELEIVEVEGKFYIQSFDNVASGLPKKIISPPFKSLKELVDWWNLIKDLFYIEDGDY